MSAVSCVAPECNAEAMQIVGVRDGLGLCLEHRQILRGASSNRVLVEGWIRDYTPQRTLPLEETQKARDESADLLRVSRPALE